MFKKKNQGDAGKIAAEDEVKPAAPKKPAAAPQKQAPSPSQPDAATSEKVVTQNASAAFINAHLSLYQNNQALKKQIQMLTLLLVLLAMVLGILIWAFLYNYPKYRYIATTDNRSICNVSTQDRPSITPAALENFAQEAILDVYRYDYVNIESQVQAALNRFFTFNGRASFFQSLVNSGNFDKVKANKLISKATAIRSAQIEKQLFRYGRYEWVITIPIRIDFYVGSSEINKQSEFTQNFNVTMTVVQETASRINPKGVAVDAIVLNPA